MHAPTTGEERRGKRSNATGDKTSGQFLDAAERLFARYGYEGTRIRAIADESGVALGALHYYWGTKQALFAAVLERRLGPLMRQREELLGACEAAAADGSLEIADVVRAIVAPPMIAASADGEAGEVFAGLMARTLTDPAPEVRDLVLRSVGAMTLRYMTLLRQCCPHLDDEAFRWRFFAALGAAQNGYAGRTRFSELTGDTAAELDTAVGIEEMVAFIAAGLAAPATHPA